MRAVRSDAIVLIGMLAFVGLFLGTVFFALALPAWQDVHEPAVRVTGTIVGLRV